VGDYWEDLNDALQRMHETRWRAYEERLDRSVHEWAEDAWRPPEPEPWHPPATWRAAVLGEPGGALSGEVQQYDPSTDRWRTVRLDMIHVTDNRKVF
jgi:hypothetical protein